MSDADSALEKELLSGVVVNLSFTLLVYAASYDCTLENNLVSLKTTAFDKPYLK